MLTLACLISAFIHDGSQVIGNDNNSRGSSKVSNATSPKNPPRFYFCAKFTFCYFQFSECRLKAINRCKCLSQLWRNSGSNLFHKKISLISHHQPVLKLSVSSWYQPTTGTVWWVLGSSPWATTSKRSWRIPTTTSRPGTTHSLSGRWFGDQLC